MIGKTDEIPHCINCHHWDSPLGLIGFCYEKDAHTMCYDSCDKFKTEGDGDDQEE